MPQTYTISFKFYLDRNAYGGVGGGNGRYFKVLSLNKQPEGALAQHVSLIHNTPLSPYRDRWNSGGCGGGDDDPTDACCFYGIKRLPEMNASTRRDDCPYLCVDDMDSLINFAINNDYNVDYNLTKLMRGFKPNLLLVLTK